jgi:ubiquinone/menaquinone biosynthesis C-methylase UbiE
VLSAEQARRVYDRIGARQDTQGFYENPALDRLVRAASFGQAQAVVELGCGTGRFAKRLLNDELPEHASYAGFDISPTMVGLARERLQPFRERAAVTLTDGSVELPLADRCCDRFVSNYVLDLLPEETIRAVVREAARVLRPGGRLCVVSLTFGTTVASRAVIAVWRTVHRVSPGLTGGCRPIDLGRFVQSDPWRVMGDTALVSWGVPSEVVVAELGAGSDERRESRR